MEQRSWARGVHVAFGPAPEAEWGDVRHLKVHITDWNHIAGSKRKKADAPLRGGRLRESAFASHHTRIDGNFKPFCREVEGLGMRDRLQAEGGTCFPIGALQLFWIGGRFARVQRAAFILDGLELGVIGGLQPSET